MTREKIVLRSGLAAAGAGAALLTGLFYPNSEASQIDSSTPSTKPKPTASSTPSPTTTPQDTLHALLQNGYRQIHLQGNGEFTAINETAGTCELTAIEKNTNPVEYLIYYKGQLVTPYKNPSASELVDVYGFKC